MSEKLKNLLIKILFRLIDVGGKDTEEDDKEIQRWLATSAGDIGCIRYFQVRERKMIRELLIDGLLPTPRDSFIRKTGQRFELHAFFTRAQIAQKKLHDRRKLKEREENN